MKARRDTGPAFSSRASRAAKAGLWLSRAYTLPVGCGVSTLLLLRELERAPMVGLPRSGRCAPERGTRHPHPAAGMAISTGLVWITSGRYELTKDGRAIMNIVRPRMPEIDAVWKWVETGVGGVPVA